MQDYAKIEHLAYALPEKILENAELATQFLQLSVEKIEQKTGIFERRIVSDAETAFDLGVKASKKLFQERPDCFRRVDCVIFCTQSSDYILPPNACLLQKALELPCSVAAFDITHGCSGFVYGLSLAKAMVESRQAKGVLLVTAETYSKYLASNDHTTRTIFGDGAAATFIGVGQEEAIGAVVFETDGAGAPNLIVKRGGARNPLTAKSFEDADKLGEHLYMNGPAIFQYTLEAVPRLMDVCLKKHNVGLDSIDFFVFHQANAFMLKTLATKCKIPDSKFIYELSDIGNTVSSTIPIAMRRGIDMRKLTAGSLIMIIGFGVGYSSAATIVKL